MEKGEGHSLLKVRSSRGSRSSHPLENVTMRAADSGAGSSSGTVCIGGNAYGAAVPTDRGAIITFNIPVISGLTFDSKRSTELEPEPFI